MRGPSYKLAQYLEPFEITARKYQGPDRVNKRGYLRAHFTDAWTRYCPIPTDDGTDQGTG